MIVEDSGDQSNKIENEERIEQVQAQKEDHKTLNHHSLYYNFIQRYFVSYQNPTEILHMHSNGLFLIRVKVETLPSKPINIRDVLFIQEVKGKKKRGGSRVNKNTVIVEIECQNGERVPILCLVDGVIIQKNPRCTLNNLQLPQGYIAIINPTRKMKFNTTNLKEIQLPHQLKHP